jgi:hypothetical protein
MAPPNGKKFSVPKNYPLSPDIEDRRHEHDSAAPVKGERAPGLPAGWDRETKESPLVKQMFPKGRPPKMHDGGIVPKTGVYTLQKGEKVTPMADEKNQKSVKVKDVLSKEDSKPAEKKDSSESKAKKSKSRHKHTHIEHHYDESGKSMGHTIRHSGSEDGKEVSYAASDLDAVHDGLEQHVGEPNAGEGAETPEQPAPAAGPAAAGPQAGAPPMGA